MDQHYLQPSFGVPRLQVSFRRWMFHLRWARAEDQDAASRRIVKEARAPESRGGPVQTLQMISDTAVSQLILACKRGYFLPY